MLLKRKLSLAAILLAFGFFNFGCEDEKQPEEQVKPDAAKEEAAPPPEAKPVDSTFVAETVYFAFDDYTLNNEAMEKLNKMAEHLKASTNTIVQIEGHCDERGSIEYNLALGEKRAQSVKTYLTSLGIDAVRLTTISYGEEKPAADGHDEAAWTKNRRAEFVLSNQ